jgi:hypothetical protein
MGSLAPTSPAIAYRILLWIILLFILSACGLLVYHGYNPQNKLTKPIDAFWSAPGVTKVRKLIRGVFWFILLLLAVPIISYYYNESPWYPREREVAVFFEAHQWIEREIRTCYSEATEKTPDAELTAISCSLEGNEFHVLRVKFWGPIRADRHKAWKCERSQTSMTCRLQ